MNSCSFFLGGGGQIFLDLSWEGGVKYIYTHLGEGVNTVCISH